MERALVSFAAVLLLSVATPRPEAQACTNFLITKGASADGSTMITYAADSHQLYGALRFRPAATHRPGSVRKIFDWDSGKYLGTIPQVERTYRVVGNMNEHQVVIGETTYGGRKELRDPDGGIDYGSLIYVALERARTAREAIKIMTDLVAAHGFYSHGETFSIADPNEVWIMDMIAKGKGSKGAVWVARLVPDGYVSAHANQARIRQFPLHAPKTCLYAKDVISFAREKGYFRGKDEEFSFADAYAPPSCRDLRIREARVWSFFHHVAPSLKISSDYAACRPGAKPMPLWVEPDRKLTPADIMRLMRDHFEGTEFDMTRDVGAGPFGLPYRWRPLVWKVDGKKYLNERAIATQQTGFSFVSQSRAKLPNPVGGLQWFSVDDAASTVYIPIYAGIRQVPRPYAFGTASFTKFSWESAFWVFNWVANFAYTRYRDIIQDIRKVQSGFEGGFLKKQAAVEKQAAALYARSPDQAETFLTRYSVTAGEKVVTRWRRLGEELLMKYLDGNVRNAQGKATHPPYPKHWYRRIVAETGGHFLISPQGKPRADRSALPTPDAPRSRPRPAAASGADDVPLADTGARGCGCRAGGAPPIGGLLVGLALGWWAARRRRRQ